MIKTLLVAAFSIAAFGCSREPLPEFCPPVQEGGLVVSELRGDQSDNDDTFGEWIEIYNASGIQQELQGLHLDLVRLDGSSPTTIIVRRSLIVPQDGYAVLGRHLPSSVPEHVNYGYAEDFDKDLFDSGAIDLYACDVHVDRTVYRNLPATGSLGVDGAEAPTAEANDEEGSWCVDSDTGLEFAEGTPGGRNLACN
jgi:hypothetical protein